MKKRELKGEAKEKKNEGGASLNVNSMITKIKSQFDKAFEKSNQSQHAFSANDTS